MNIALWILQGFLAIIFLIAGGIKVIKSKDELKALGGEKMNWVDSTSAISVKLIGTLEVLAAIGLILPQLTGIMPGLVPLAAFGLVLTMIGAMIFHHLRGEGPKAIMPVVILLLMAAFTTYGRFDFIPV
jgi:hypothetical protein|tara:strand:- start:75 stop:461 length:387 start_codon:yes stop_codon:yes gene_type:complete